MVNIEKFQSLIGELKTEVIVSPYLRGDSEFQSLIGELKTR